MNREIQYIAFLRGINVAGKNILSMERLLNLAIGLEFKEIRTYLQSGNLIFRACKNAASVQESLAALLRAELGSDIPVLIRTLAEVEKVAENNPFLAENPRADVARLHVTLFDGKPATAELKRLAMLKPSVKAPLDQFRIVENAVYLQCHGGYSDTRLQNGVIEKALGVAATTRNWKTLSTVRIIARLGYTQ